MVSTSSTTRGADTYTVVNPATEQPVIDVHLASVAETDALIERAHAAFPAWKAVAPGERARLLRRFAQVVDDHVEELAELEVRNAGHTWGNATWEAGNVRDCLNYYSAAPERLFGRQIPVPGGIDVTFHEPLGVIGVIVPWNFPMTIASWGFAPALAAGNAVLLKPSEVTPSVGLAVARIAQEAGLPPGILNVLPGTGAVTGHAIIHHPGVRMVSFTGGTQTGRNIATVAAQRLIPVALELGGKSPHIIFDDAQLEAAVAGVVDGIFEGSGQSCVAGSRLFVQRKVLDRVLAMLVERANGLRVDLPDAPGARSRTQARGCHGLSAACATRLHRWYVGG